MGQPIKTSGIRGDQDQLRRERDLLLALIGLHQNADPGSLLPEALDLLVDATGAQCGYIEVIDERISSPEKPWFAASGFSDEQIENIRAACSRGIVSAAIATGQTLHIASAQSDPRFKDFDSVRLNRIEAVLCAPVGEVEPIGVIYLQNHPERGPFSLHAENLIKTVTHTLSPIFKKLITETFASENANTAEQLLPYPGLIAHSQEMKDVLSKLALAASLDATLLLTGASGTGKSLLARAVHTNSPRNRGPFVEVNCAALQDTLLENELFGAAPGGHSTTPRSGTVGKVAAAEGGTLFLDEVGELSTTAQAKLLQLLQSKSYFRVGDSHESKADVRIITASNANLDEAVTKGRFREDLLYRLRVLEVRIPSLSEHGSDVPALAKNFLKDACDRHGVETLELTPAALHALVYADWPGNIRQLANTLETGVLNALLQDSRVIVVEHLFPNQKYSGSRTSSRPPRTLHQQMHEFRGRVVADALREADWNVSEAARRLDVARSYLYKLIRAHNLERE